jgi:hypothetical protein
VCLLLQDLVQSCLHCGTMSVVVNAQQRVIILFFLSPSLWRGGRWA